MPPPTLPTELIEHILELLYEDIKSPPPDRHPDFDLLDGQKVIFTFRPLFLVSKAFHALSVPIAVRNLFVGSTNNISERVASFDCKYPPLKFLEEQDLERKVESVTLPAGLTLDEQHGLLRRCTGLKKAFIRDLPHVGTLSYLSCTLTTLTICSDVIFRESDLITLSASFPELAALGLQVTWDTSDNFEPATVWKLRVLDLGRIRGAARPLLHWLRSSSSTLCRLWINSIDAWVIQGQLHLRAVDLLQEVGTSMVSLVSLGIMAHPVDGQSQSLSASILPCLRALSLASTPNTLTLIHGTSATLSRVYLLLYGGVLAPNSRTTAALHSLVRSHKTLDLLAVDTIDADAADAPIPGWSEKLRFLCDRRGIVFASNDPSAWDEHGGSEYVLSDDDDDSQSSIGSSGVDEELDFDAEDDEMWAATWSEEKREAMGLMAKLECAAGEEGARLATDAA